MLLVSRVDRNPLIPLTRYITSVAVITRSAKDAETSPVRVRIYSATMKGVRRCLTYYYYDLEPLKFKEPRNKADGYRSSDTHDLNQIIRSELWNGE